MDASNASSCSALNGWVVAGCAAAVGVVCGHASNGNVAQRMRQLANDRISQPNFPLTGTIVCFLGTRLTPYSWVSTPLAHCSSSDTLLQAVKQRIVSISVARVPTGQCVFGHGRRDPREYRARRDVGTAEFRHSGKPWRQTDLFPVNSLERDIGVGRSCAKRDQANDLHGDNLDDGCRRKDHGIADIGPIRRCHACRIDEDGGIARGARCDTKQIIERNP